MCLLLTSSQKGLHAVLAKRTHMRCWVCSEVQADKSAGCISWALHWHCRKQQEECRGKRMLMNHQRDSRGMRKYLLSFSGGGGEGKVRKSRLLWIFADVMNFHMLFCFFFGVGHGLLLSQ